MPDRDLIPTDSILYNSRIIGSLIWKELQSSPSSGLSTKEGSGSGGMGRPREAKLSGRGTALPSCSCVTLDPVFPLLTSKTKQKFGFLHVHMKISLSFGNSVTKLPYPSSYLLHNPPTPHTHKQKTKNFYVGHISVYGFHSLWALPYWCLWSGPVVFYPRWGNGGPEKRSDLTKVISLDSLLQSSMKRWQIILF